MATGIADTVLEHAKGRKPRKVVLDIGVFSGVLPESLLFYLELIFEERIAGKVEIESRTVAARCACACGNEYQVTRFLDPCPRCGGFDRRITEGKDCVIESVEVDDE